MPENELLSDETPDSQTGNTVGSGFVLWLILLVMFGLLLVGLAAVLSAFGTGSWMVLVLLQPGFWQLLFVVPGVIVLRKKRRFEAAKGLLMSASGLFMLNVLCTGSLFLSSLRR